MQKENKEEDTYYWDNYYQKGRALENPSPFAQRCLQKIPQNSCIFELGCGNGRDSLFFAKNGHEVIACDLSKVAIRNLNVTKLGNFFVGDFSQLKDNSYATQINVVYSRFTLHSVETAAASRAMNWVHKNLVPNGLLLIEVRSVKDKLFGKGKQVSKDSFITDHFRRFIRKEELESELRDIGFKIKESFEGSGLAVYNDEDPIVIRIIAQKKNLH
jgi:SAM-dependent methyltransferase